MAKKTRGGGHHHQRPRRPTASSRVSITRAPSPAVKRKGLGRVVIAGVVAVVVMLLLGTALVIGRPGGTVTSPTDPPIVVPGASTAP